MLFPYNNKIKFIFLLILLINNDFLLNKQCNNINAMTVFNRNLNNTVIINIFSLISLIVIIQVKSIFYYYILTYLQ